MVANKHRKTDRSDI